MILDASLPVSRVFAVRHILQRALRFVSFEASPVTGFKTTCPDIGAVSSTRADCKEEKDTEVPESALFFPIAVLFLLLELGVDRRKVRVSCVHMSEILASVVVRAERMREDEESLYQGISAVVMLESEPKEERHE